jgi:hypothetical protein
MFHALVGFAHVPSVQSSPALQLAPHFPQLAKLASRSTHTPPHLVNPVLHAHDPATHASFALHATPQLPQCIGSLDSSTHAPRHVVFPFGHVHVLLAQSKPKGHVNPHAPQLSGSESSSTHFAVTPPSSVNCCGHGVAVLVHPPSHCPARHATCGAHFVEHDPQCDGS